MNITLINNNKLIINTVIIVQARTNSFRLPNKVLTLVNGIPLLGYLINRLAKTNDKTKIIIATSDKLIDDPIEKYCIEQNIICFRDSLLDVARRMLSAAKHFDAGAFVRINGDSPLIDCALIDYAVDIFQNGDYDLVTNTFPRSFPVGQSVEVIRTSTFEKAYQKMTKPEEFEHVTKYCYDHPDDFKIHNFKNETDLSNYRLAVDTAEDLQCFKKIIDRMDRPYTEYSMNDIIALYPS